MSNLDMIKYDDNGQAFIDFDSLESITSKAFVEEVVRFIDNLELSWNVKKNHLKKIDIKKYVDDSCTNVTVYLAGVTEFICIFNFFKSRASEKISSVVVPYFELEDFLHG